MTDHKRFGEMMSAIFRIGGELLEANLYNTGFISVEGILKDGRKVHFFVSEKSGEAAEDVRSES